MDIVERVARALCEENNLGSNPASDDLIGPTKNQKRRWQLFEADARAAIEAMREPTEAMIDAGVTSDRGKTIGDLVTNTYAAMIDTALKDSSHD